MAHLRHADCVEQCPSSRAKRKTYARTEFFSIWTQSRRARQLPQFSAWWREICLHWHLRLVRFRIPDRDAAEGEVEMFISQKDGRMSRILTIGAAQLGPTQRSGDRASVVQRMLDLMRQARQRVILRD